MPRVGVKKNDRRSEFPHPAIASTRQPDRFTTGIADRRDRPVTASSDPRCRTRRRSPNSVDQPAPSDQAGCFLILSHAPVDHAKPVSPTRRPGSGIPLNGFCQSTSPVKARPQHLWNRRLQNGILRRPAPDLETTPNRRKQKQLSKPRTALDLLRKPGLDRRQTSFVEAFQCLTRNRFLAPIRGVGAAPTDDATRTQRTITRASCVCCRDNRSDRGTTISPMAPGEAEEPAVNP